MTIFAVGTISPPLQCKNTLTFLVQNRCQTDAQLRRNKTKSKYKKKKTSSMIYHGPASLQSTRGLRDYKQICPRSARYTHKHNSSLSILFVARSLCLCRLCCQAIVAAAANRMTACQPIINCDRFSIGSEVWVGAIYKHLNSHRIQIIYARQRQAFDGSNTAANTHTHSSCDNFIGKVVSIFPLTDAAHL